MSTYLEDEIRSPGNLWRRMLELQQGNHALTDFYFLHQTSLNHNFDTGIDSCIQLRSGRDNPNVNIL